MMTIGMALAEQYDRGFEMLRATIARFTDDNWRTGETPALVPARWALHAVEAMDAYNRSERGAFRRGHRFGVDWEAEAERLPSRQQVQTYLDEVQADLQAWLLSVSDTELLQGRNDFSWTGDTLLQLMLYALRHTMTHQGELSMLLRLRGADETEWR